jgi:hypothetical protein
MYRIFIFHLDQIVALDEGDLRDVQQLKTLDHERLVRMIATFEVTALAAKVKGRWLRLRNRHELGSSCVRRRRAARVGPPGA